MTQKEVDSCKRDKVCAVASYQESVPVGHWRGNRASGGSGGQLGPGGAVTMMPGSGTSALGDGSTGPGDRQTQVQASATSRCILGRDT